MSPGNVRSYVEWTAKGAYLWGSFRIGWSADNGSVYVPRSWQRKLLTIFNFVAHLAYATFVLIRCIQLCVVQSNVAQPVKLSVQFGLIVHLFPVICLHLCVLMKEDRVVGLYNQFLRYTDARSGGVRENVVPKECRRLLSFYYLIGKVIRAADIILRIATPQLPNLPSSVHAEPLVLWQRVLYAVLEIYIIGTWWSNAFFVITFLILYVFVTWSHMKQTSGIGQLSRRGLTQLAKDYRCSQLLQTRANDVFRFPVGGLKVVFLMHAIRCLFGAIKVQTHHRVFYLLVGTAVIRVYYALFRALGTVNQASLEVLESWKGRRASPWFRRFHRSCWPLKFEVAGMYFVDAGMILTMSSFILENTANMLIVGV